MGASAKLKEHYGIDIPGSTVRAVTERHGEAMLARQESENDLPNGKGVAVLITEMDGTMLPVVETAEPKAAETPIDRRKTRKLCWKEVRLCLAHAPGSVTPVFGATTGGVEEAGQRWQQCAIAAGAGNQTKFHGLGDGASWITDQIELQFGTQAHYLIDFYHLCEYVSAAADVVAGNEKEVWMEEKKNWLKENRWQDVLKSLEPFLEDSDIADKDAPVRACQRYIANRSNYLDYKAALADGLPIGSGEIESAHRYVFQVRLKIAGAWWKMENLGKMVALRVLRANRRWDHYWSATDLKAA